MKNKFALIIIGGTLGVMNAVLPAVAYAPHEHPFFHDERIKSMTQTEGNGYCRNLFNQLKATGDLGGGFDPNRVNHVWSHIQNGDCVANT
ncbi:MAG: hypothetical protein ACK4YK_15385 [Dolichospermum sp.]